ncbi:MAG: cyclase family protein [Actinobacteria bacterium]|nr:cyclase family protein [Actinomycetota bacterium]
MRVTEYRAQFDAVVTFSNGGGLRADGFRVDVPGPGVTEDEVAGLFIASLSLLLVGSVELRNLTVFAEPHKGTHAGPSDRPAAPVPGRGRIVDLSHPIADGRVTGYPDGPDPAALPLAACVDLPAVLARTAGTGVRAVGVGTLAAIEVTGRAVLLHTGGDTSGGESADATDAPYLTEDGARWLADHGARLVGIDAASIDAIEDGRRPARSILRAAGIPVVEHLTGLAQLPPTGFWFSAAPIPFAGAGPFPARAYATVPA